MARSNPGSNPGSIEMRSIRGAPVRISGETVIARISGETVLGEFEAKVSGEVVRVSGETVIARISGETVLGEFEAKVSGEAVRISGETIVAKISGETVAGTFVAAVSGQPVKVSGEIVGIQTPTTIKGGDLRAVTGASGGEVLHSGSVKSVNIKALSGNSGDIYVLGSGDRPYSGHGFLLAAGEVVSLDISNFDGVYLFATASGDLVTFMGLS